MMSVSGYRRYLAHLHHRIRKLRAESAAPQMTFFFRSTHPYRLRHANKSELTSLRHLSRAVTRARIYIYTYHRLCSVIRRDMLTRLASSVCHIHTIWYIIRVYSTGTNITSIMPLIII